jgi:hypothetical protein
MASKNERRHAVERALCAVAPNLELVHEGRWDFTLSNGANMAVRARLADEWLEMTTTLGQPMKTVGCGMYSLLELNADLAGLARTAIDLRARDQQLRAEICLADEGDFDRRVAVLCEDLRLAFHRSRDGAQLRLLEPLEGQVSTPERFRSLCIEAGWPTVKKTSCELALELDPGFGVYQAHLQTSADNKLRLVVPLLDVSEYSTASREATGLLLLATSAMVRSVKGVVVSGEGANMLGVAAASESPRSGVAMNRLLSALTGVCSLVGREVLALRDETLAHEYLALWGPTAKPTSNQNKEEPRCLQLL